MPEPRADRLHSLADAYMAALEAGETAAVDQISRAWVTVLERVQIDVDMLLKKLEAARLAGVPISPAWLYQERRLANLVDLIHQETRRWAPYAERMTAELVASAVQRGLQDAEALTREMATAYRPGIEATFATINPAVLTHLSAHLAPGGPLRGLLLGYGAEAASAAQQALLEGVVTGKGSAWITRRLKDALDIPRWRAETLARSESLRAYREASRETYAASNVVGSWEWSASLDRRCCPGCIGMHGTIHPNTETLDGHPRCRCAMIPRTMSWAQIDARLADLPDTQPVTMTGADWLALQPKATQLQLLGPLKYQALQAGQITVADMVARTWSPTWGFMRRERSMLEIRQRRNANTLPEVGRVG